VRYYCTKIVWLVGGGRLRTKLIVARQFCYSNSAQAICPLSIHTKVRPERIAVERERDWRLPVVAVAAFSVMLAWQEFAAVVTSTSGEGEDGGTWSLWL
jgi:hypothetical protein